ncbi:MAG: ABC transporter ATP-binding protein [Clostridia bacterium]|nr:ABC transporter ATP-binding protein [Clostridia bacterium]
MSANKEEKKIKPGAILRNNIFLLKLAWRYTPLYVTLCVLEGVLWGINNAVEVYYTKMLFDMLGRNEPFERVIKLILFMAAYYAVFWMFHYWYWKIQNGLEQKKLQYRIHSKLFEKARELDLACYDNPEFYNDFVWSINESDGRINKQLTDLGKLINRIVASLLVTTVLVTIHPLLAVIILAFTAIRIILQMQKAKVDHARALDFNPLDRKTDYINRMFRLADCAKEIRLTHVSENLLSEYEKTIEEKKAVVRKYSKKRYFLSISTWIMMNVADGAVMLFLLYELLVTKSIELGDFAAGVNTVWRLSWLLRDLMDRIVKSKEHALYVDKLRTFLAYEPKLTSGIKIPQAFNSLEVRGLHFAYGEEEILSDISFKIARGDKIAFVGYNGAGKTTLIKLLMRLYDPTAGEILYNGINIKEYDLAAYRACIGTVFQDYKIFAANIAENVLADEYREKENETVLSALSKSAFSEKLATLEKGIETELTREFFAEGTELSGGEAQKVAIARVFARPCELLIMDEPSSALDPVSEYNLNHSILESAEDKTVVFISHRLSTTRHADKIYMFENGRLIERGTHEELMASNGKYAYMFNLQAKKYAEGSVAV